MLNETVLYPYSMSVDREKAVQSGALTSLPIRIHRHNHLADAGALCLTNHWGRIMKDGQDRKSHGSPSIVGNWGSFIWPESIPDRLGLLCYLLDIGCFHDDACEEMSIAAAYAEHLDLDAAMDIEDQRALSSDSKSARTKQLVSTAILECIKVDRIGALRMLESYRKNWLAIMETYNTDEIESLDEYFVSRANNGGMRAYYAMVEFSLDIVVTDEDYKMLAQPLLHVERCMLLTNDFWSWPREHERAKIQDCGKVFNTVWFLMKQTTCSEEKAISEVRKMVSAEERKWIEAKDSIYRQHPDIRPELVRFLENLNTALAGNDYWSSQCYRYNDWEHVPEHPSDHWPKVHELVSLGRALMDKNPPDVWPGQQEAEEEKMNIVELAMNFDTKNAPTNSAISSRSTPRHSDFGTPTSSESKTSLGTSISGESERISNVLGSQIIEEPIKYIKSMPSKGFRTQLVDCLNLWLDVPGPTVSAIKQVIDSLHDSSLILDDIEDGSNLRRGFPATHIVYGTGQAINSATFLYIQAVEAVHSAAHINPGMMDVFLKYVKQMFLGQSWDLHWTFHRKCPTKEQYLEMIDQKTGAMIQMVVDLMLAAKPQTATGSDANDLGKVFSRFTRLVGRFFQVRDDYMNLTSIDYSRQKGFAEDLDEQKFSYVLVHMFQTCPETQDRVEGIFKAMKSGIGAVSETRKRDILTILEETGSMDASRRLLLKWQDEISDEIRALEAHFGSDNAILHLLVETLRI